MFGFLALAFLGSNLLMQSHWGRGWVETKLKNRTRMDWRIGNISWTPWSGIRLADIRAEVATPGAGPIEPVCRVAEIRVVPDWRQLLRGQRGWRRVVVRQPDLVVPVELVAAMVPRSRLVKIEPSVAARPVAPPPPGGGRSPAPAPSQGDAGAAAAAKPAEPSTSPKAAAAPKPAPKAPVVPKRGEKAPEAPPRPPPGPTRRIMVEGGRLALYSLARPDLRIEMRGLSAEVPVVGEDSSGWVSGESVSFAGQPAGAAWREELEWKRPALILSERERDWGWAKAKLRGTAQLRGFVPSTMELRLLPGVLGPLEHPELPGAEGAAQRFEAVARFSGELLRTTSWRGEAAMEARGITLARERGREPFTFDVGRMVASYSGGLARVPDIRLTSERLSFLGNGLALSDGRVWAVMRIVADPELAEVFRRAAIGAVLTNGWTSAWLLPLETPDRHFRDFHFRGSVVDLKVDVGRKREEMAVAEAWRRVGSFWRREKGEDEAAEVDVLPQPDRADQ
jgi:hypothetical protein